jgi:sugar phosphate isomerase/epimerase
MLYNRVGEKCRSHGMKLYYHNHFHEFQVIAGECVLDTIVANTEPELLTIELDTYWTMRGGVDPVAAIERYGSRIGILHQKDFPLSEVSHLDLWAGRDRNAPMDKETFDRVNIRPEEFVEVGDGIMKVQEIIAAANQANVSYMLVEQDHGHLKTEFDRLERARENLKRMQGLDWS